MEIRDILLIIFTAAIAGATIYYASVTQRLWRATRHNAELSRKSFQYTLLSHYKEPLGEASTRRIMEAVFADDFSEILKEIEETKGVTEEDIIKKLREGITDIELKQLVEGGQIKQAVIRAESEYSQDSSKGLQLINILLESKEEKDWNRAWQVLKETKEGKPAIYISLSYSFFSINRVKDAIEIGEEGLKVSEKQRDEVCINRSKNNLAYYYAEVGDLSYEEVARRYAREASIGLPDDPTKIDTEGYVKIVYGKTADEVKEGVYLCEEGRRKGLPFEWYIKHINKANERLSSL